MNIAENGEQAEDFFEFERLINEAIRRPELISDEEVIASLSDDLDRSVIVGPWSKKVSEIASKTASKKVSARFRKSDANDLRTLVIIRKSEKAREVRSRHSVSDLQTPISAPEIALKASRKGVPTSSKETIPVWEKTSDRLKITFINRALSHGGYAFSLNVTDAVIEKAHQYRLGFAAYFKREIDAAWKKVLPTHPTWWFHVDISDRGRLHLHGTFLASPQEIEAIKIVMCSVGGAWRPQRRGEEQFHFRLLDERVDVWSRYCMRNSARVRRKVKGAVYCRTHDLTGIAKGIYGQIKRRIAST